MIDHWNQNLAQLSQMPADLFKGLLEESGDKGSGIFRWCDSACRVGLNAHLQSRLSGDMFDVEQDLSEETSARGDASAHKQVVCLTRIEAAAIRRRPIAEAHWPAISSPAAHPDAGSRPSRPWGQTQAPTRMPS